MKNIKFSQIAVATVLAFTGVFAVGSVLPTGVAAAEEAESTSSAMTISPMRQRMVLTPGETTQGTVKISNSNSAMDTLKYSVHIGSFSQHQSSDSPDDYGTVDTDTVSNYNQLMQWITLDQTTGEVAPNQTAVVSFTIKVPEDAPAGGQYATIIFKNENNEDQNSAGGINIKSDVQIASIIYAEVAGTSRTEGAILSNDVPSFLLSSPLKATSMVQNNGNIHTDVEYTLQVWPIFSDEEICTNEEDPAKSLILPETKQYHVETCDLGMVGLYRAKQTVKIFGETSIVERTILICPIWLIFIIIAVVCLIIFYLAKRAHDRRRPKANRKSS